MLDEPGRQALPLAGGAAVDGQPRLGVLVFALLQLFGHFLQRTPNHKMLVKPLKKAEAAVL